MKNYYPGTRVKAFDSSLYKDDKTTPLSITVKEAEIVKWYGVLKKDYGEDLVLGPYPNLVDLFFYHSGKISKGHFVDCLR